MIRDVQLSAHVWLHDYLKSDTAQRYPLVLEQQYNPPQIVVDNLIRFNREIDEPLFSIWPQINRTSTYRCPDFKDAGGNLLKGLNSLVGGSPTSAHRFGRAGDREPYLDGREASGPDYREFILQIIARKIRFDKIIIEFGTLKKPAWVHLQVNENPAIARGIILRVGSETGGQYIPFDVRKWNPS